MRSLTQLSLLALAALPFQLTACDGGTESTTGTGGGTTTGETTSSTDPTAAIDYPALGAVSGDSGKGSFRFGAASAATQIEDQNTNTDWYVWTLPKDQGGLGKGTFVGDAVKGYTLAEQDIDLMVEMGLDSYRFSIEWARVEPQKDQIDEAALQHYSDFIDALIAKGIRPMVTIHHFSNPLWIDDPRDAGCANGPTDQNLCGWNHPQGGAMVAEQLAEHAKLIAERFGDRVDDWCTLNEPVNYLLAGYGVGNFPPGKSGILGNITEEFMPAVRNFMNAHALMYDAMKDADTTDADGDGVAASVGFTKEAGEWVAAAENEISEAEVDVKAKEGVLWVYQYMFAEAFIQGGFDTDLSGDLDEPHPEWKGKLDWMGVQYYFRAGVTGSPGLLPLVAATPCFGTFDFGACVPPLDPTYAVPDMEYEHYPQGLYNVLSDFGKRWPKLPLTVTESGIATSVGARRAEVIVRALESIDRAQKEGVDVRGYYHWSLTDNFEWALGFKPHFGLYEVDYSSPDLTRTPTLGATVLGEIIKARTLTTDHRKTYGGEGPLTAESGM
ncbi:MAG: glycoside hydrolase family 1 protein [Polyangiaceae bacterium]|nr:glycoside hydrolase family 1 protein [Polyangiaceae bacterium]